MLRVGIDAHMLGDRSGGNESFYEGILKAFVPDKDKEYILFMNQGVDDSPYRDRFRIVRFNSGNAFVRNFVELTRLCRKYRLDVLHTQYYIPFIRPCKTVVTIHDICFEHFDDIFKKSEYYRNKLLVPYAARHSDRIITVSEFSKNDIVETYGIDEKKVCVAYNAVDSDFRILSKEEIDSSIVRDKFGVGNVPYIISVGNLQPRKNIPRLIDAYLQYKKQKQSDLKLVIVGKKAWLYDKTLDSAGQDAENIVLTGYVSRQELIELLNQAEGFVYPSYYEGFGIPPLEALSCGTKVAVADIPVMHEVLEDSPIYFDPFDVDSIAHAIDKLYDQEDNKTSIQAGSERKVTERFSWSKSAGRINDAYNM